MDTVSHQRLLVIGFPPAGGSEATFREIFGLKREFDTYVVKYPGRGVGMAGWATDTGAVVTALAAGRAPVLLGAGLGAMAALETAQYLESRRLPLAGVVLMSSVAPQWRSLATDRAWPDSALIDFLRSGTENLPASFESPAVSAYALAALRRDLEWEDEYQGPRYWPLSCPMTVLRGEHDVLVPEREGTGQWAMWTAGQFTCHTVPAGNHRFFASPSGAGPVLDALRRFVPSRI
ncbi:thioesterase II family protein [Amycolatopsis sp. EV170708-02-1]|uniref:thioesterase II family protein n=1 Tax=Amycolatopsis sp. EV170708-02-1 TaxID=2919322 RepID=UPI001F0C4AFF|nr:thioesterase domain-containing protein [Amycolatopsis sp. EV170708-02-1]UMP06938.1 thioesterase domain-containing protein [Amycolatopsis sp. EV170708-02-1]